MEFNIGNIVVIKQPEAIVDRSRGIPYAWTKRKGNTAGEVGEIVDKMYSEAEGKYLYRICIDGETRTRAAFYTEEDLELYVKERKADYCIESEVLDNVCLAIVYRIEGDEKVEVVRGHGHIIHEGDLGIVQAFSYALKKAYEKMNGGEL